MTTYSSIDEWLRDCLNVARKIVGEDVLGYKIPEKIYLVNTKRGNREYRRITGKIPNLYARFAGDEYGRVESYEGKHFIFLHDTLIRNLAEEDVVATLIHEILHIIFPQEDEKGISKIERDLCRMRGIERENLLDQVER